MTVFTYIQTELKIEDKDFRNCYRAGAIRKDNDGNTIPRPLIIEMSNIDKAEYWHDYGRGYRTDNGFWINPDLCKADRSAQFFARDEQRKRMQQKNIQKST